jgi:hypothetical protein
MLRPLRSGGFVFLLALAIVPALHGQSPGAASEIIVLHAAHLLDVESGRLVTPGEVLVRGNRIAEAGSSVTHPSGATRIDLGAATLMPGLIDAHVHLFLHPGAEDFQTVVESVPERTILAGIAAREDLMAASRPSAIWEPRARGRRIQPCAMRSTPD